MGPGEQEAADRLVLVTQARAGHLDGGGQRLDRLVLAEDHEFQIALEILQHLAVGSGHALGRDARHARDHVLDVADFDDRLALGHRPQPQARARLIDHVDGLVRQVAFVDVAGGQLGRRLQRVVRYS